LHSLTLINLSLILMWQPAAGFAVRAIDPWHDKRRLTDA
jgi:hypothetical protein